MRTQFNANTTSRVLGNRQDSRFVTVTNSGHAIALTHSIPAWHWYAAAAEMRATAMKRALKSACRALTGRLASVRVRMPSPVVDRSSDRPAPPACVSLV